MNISYKKVAVLGYGVVGKAVVTYAIHQQADITLFDQKKILDLSQDDQDFLEKHGVTFVGGVEEADDLTEFDVIVSSPGISRFRRDIAEAETEGVPVYTDITLFIEVWNGSGALIGITGSNGKSTVVSLFEAALQASRRPVLMGGNIGKSPLAWLTDQNVPKDATIVLELSSYALEYFDDRHVLDVSGITSFSENHLSRHGDLETYAQAKVSGIEVGVTQVYLADTEGVREYVFPLVQDASPVFINGETYKEFQDGTPTMLGDHNAVNIGLVEVILRDLDLLDKKGVKALLAYKGLEHRIELIKEKDSIRWVNDSKSTSPDATIKALEAISRKDGKTVLIAGGVDKGVSYNTWKPLITTNSIRGLIILPGPADQQLMILAEQSGVLYKVIEHSDQTQDIMNEAVKYAAEIAQSGDTVLLSPGAASLNVWNGFEARGDDFVQALKQCDVS